MGFIQRINLSRATNMWTFVALACFSFGISATQGAKTLDDVFNEITSMEGKIETQIEDLNKTLVSVDKKVARLIAPHCATAKILDDSWRHIDYANRVFDLYETKDWCDKTGNPHQGHTYHTQLTAGWYRFTGAAGTKLPTAPLGNRVPWGYGPNDQICGTEGPAYITHGGHPTLQEGIVSREVCFEGHDHKCNENVRGQHKNKKMIKVAACEDPNGVFFVYELQPVAFCSWAYCAVDDN